MNRRGLLLLGTGLLVGEPVRRAYSFLRANPLAVTPSASFILEPTADDMRMLTRWVLRYYGPSVGELERLS